MNEIPNNKIKDLLDKALSCECSLKVDSLFFGERHNPNIGASLLNFYPQTSLPEVILYTILVVKTHLFSYLEVQQLELFVI